MNLAKKTPQSSISLCLL